MKTVLVFDYHFIEHVEYPGGPGCLGTVKWNEIVEANFTTFELQDNGLYLSWGLEREDDGHYIEIPRYISFDEIGKEQYRMYKEVIENESYWFEDISIERDFLLSQLCYNELNTVQNRAWIEYWILYQHTEWTNEYEEKRARKAAEAFNT
ncbi:hypothetical protein pEaSNUABM49_00419 [Erwinia phage pEa_SNUABM_49]|nr:hypothetical protein pEaSNUABM49_00419 [Erwinia phage pEa_SNUABM_49]